jgi:hypothetical protein
MKRRDFLNRAAATAGLSAVGRGWATGTADDKLSRIAIMMYGLDRIVKNNRPASPERTLDIMDVGELCADRFHVHGVELQSNYFPETEMSWLKDFRARLNKTKTRVVQINLEFGAGMQLTADSPAGRLAMLDLHRVWMEKVAFLGCHRVLINQGQPTPANKDLAISNMKALVGIAGSKGITVSCENRGGGAPGRGAVASSGAAATPPSGAPPAAAPPSYILLAEILKAGGGFGCCDFLNFPNQEQQLEGMRAMLAITSGLAHTGDRYDLVKAMALTREVGFKGIYSLKAMGQQGDPLENTQRILDGVLANM